MGTLTVVYTDKRTGEKFTRTMVDANDEFWSYKTSQLKKMWRMKGYRITSIMLSRRIP